MEKNKKTLTLILLIMLSLVIISIIIVKVKENKTEEKYNSKLAYLISGAQKYASDNIEKVKENKETKVTLEELQKNNYIENLINPKTNTEFSKDITVIITKKEDKTEYNDVKNDYEYSIEIIN